MKSWPSQWDPSSQLQVWFLWEQKTATLRLHGWLPYGDCDVPHVAADLVYQPPLPLSVSESHTDNTYRDILLAKRSNREGADNQNDSFHLGFTIVRWDCILLAGLVFRKKDRVSISKHFHVFGPQYSFDYDPLLDRSLSQLVPSERMMSDSCITVFLLVGWQETNN